MEPHARDLHYAEVPEHFTWDKKSRKWNRRKVKSVGTKVIGRMYSACPSEGPRFYLYLLLLHRKGMKSFEDLVTVPVGDGAFGTFFEQKKDEDGHWVDTDKPDYRHAAQAMGLTVVDDEYQHTMRDAAQIRTGSQLRQLFAHILLHCEVSNVAALFASCYDDISEDHRHRLGPQIDKILEATLLGIQDILGRASKTLADFPGLPLPTGVDLTDLKNRDLERETRYDRVKECESAVEKRGKMYPAQAAAFDEIVAAVSAERAAFFFIDGPGGCGKTFVYEALLHHVRGKGHIALACAWSGIAAVLLEGGRTCHSRFGLPVPMPPEDVSSSISWKSNRAEVLRGARLIVWDEAPMAPREALDCVDRLLQDLMEVDEPFGGKVVVLGGDFRQVLPVMPHGSREEVVAHSIQSHGLWASGLLRAHTLSQNMRAREDAEWREYLLQIGNGAVPLVPSIGPFAIRLREDIVAPEDWEYMDLARFVFPDLHTRAHASAQPNCPEEAWSFWGERAILAPTNIKVDEVNKAIFETFDVSRQVTYLSIDEVDASTPEEQALWPLDFLNSLTPAGMPPHELKLVPGCLVMLLRNLDSDAGLCNGVRAIVVRALPRVLDVLLISGSKAGNRVYIPRLVLAPKNPDLPFVLRRRQFPVKLAWCMTLNKAQGQTLKRAGIFLCSPAFSHGQLYVGLSRAGSMKDVKVLVQDADAQGRYSEHEEIEDGVYTDNVVWPEALLQPQAFSQQLLHVPPSRSAVSTGPMSGHFVDPVDESQGFVLDECSGAPGQQSTHKLKQSVDRHGADDVDEFGVVAPQFPISIVDISGLDSPVNAFEESPRDSDSEIPQQVLHSQVLDDLRDAAMAHHISYSELFEVSQRSVPDIQAFLDALHTPNSGGAASSV